MSILWCCGMSRRDRTCSIDLASLLYSKYLCSKRFLESDYRTAKRIVWMKLKSHNIAVNQMNVICASLIINLCDEVNQWLCYGTLHYASLWKRLNKRESLHLPEPWATQLITVYLIKPKLPILINKKPTEQSLQPKQKFWVTDDGGSIFLQNNGNNLPDYTVCFQASVMWCHVVR
jgi:hypothetical protein